METLPPELHRRIFSLLAPRDLYHLGLTSKTLYSATDDPALWIRAIERDFLVPPERYFSGPLSNPRRFYARLLKHYGDILGFWSMHFADSFWGTSADSFGGIMRVLVEDGAIYGREILAPSFNQQFENDVIERSFFKISTPAIERADERDGRDLASVDCCRPIRFRFEEEPDFHPMIVQVDRRPNPSEAAGVDGGDVDDDRNCVDASEVVTLICRCVGSELHRRREDYRNVSEAEEITSRTDLRYYKGYETGFDFSFEARPLLELNRVHRSSGVISCRGGTGFSQGVFKGTYGRYQVELIYVRFSPKSRWSPLAARPSSSSASASAAAEVDLDGRFLEGVKLTGDPNVPRGEVSFVVDLDKPIFPTAEEQEFLPGLATMSYSEDGVVAAENAAVESGDRRFPFVRPRYAEVDVADFVFPEFCRGRFLAQVRVAKSNFTFPKLVSAHFVVFDDDLACLIVFNLYKIMLFHRVKGL